MTSHIFRIISKNLPGLDIKLKQAGMGQTPEEFVKKTLISAFYLMTGVTIFMGAILAKMDIVLSVLYFISPVLFIVLFFYFLKLPDVKILKKRRSIDKDVVFAGRFLIVELESGILLYNALKNVSKSYSYVGKAFGNVIHAVDMGIDMEVALSEAIDETPSHDLQKILWQILNSLNAGADVTATLNSVVDQISRNHIIEIQRYAKKLNPLAMFYMMIAVIVPSLGITMFVVLASFLGIQLDLGVLIGIAAMLAFIQLFFLTGIKSSRPAVNM